MTKIIQDRWSRALFTFGTYSGEVLPEAEMTDKEKEIERLMRRVETSWFSSKDVARLKELLGSEE